MLLLYGYGFVLWSRVFGDNDRHPNDDLKVDVLMRAFVVPIAKQSGIFKSADVDTLVCRRQNQMLSSYEMQAPVNTGFVCDNTEEFEALCRYVELADNCQLVDQHFLGYREACWVVWVGFGSLRDFVLAKLALT